MILNKKILIAVAIFLSVIIIALLIVVGKYSASLAPDNKVEKAEDILINNNSDIVHFNDYAYFKNEYYDDEGKFYSKISRFLIDSTDENVETQNLINLGNVSLSKELKIYKDKLYYIYSGNTQQYDLVEKDGKFFCEGELQYIDDKKIITLYNGNLYSADYYPESYSLTSYKQLTASNLKKLYEDDNKLYYIGPGSSGNLLIVYLNKENFNISIIDSAEAEFSTIEQAISTKDYLFCLVNTSGKSKIIRINLDNSKKNEHSRLSFELSDYKDIYLFKNDDKNNLYFYAKDESSETKVFCINTEKVEDKNVKIEKFIGEVKNEHLPKYSISARDNIIALYKEGKEITRINNPLIEATSYSLEDIIPIGDWLYYKIKMNNSGNSKKEGYKYKADIIIARVPIDGGISQIINNK